MELSKEFKEKVVQAVVESRKNFGGSDAAFSKTIGIGGSIFSRLKNGEIEGLLSESKWLDIAIQLGVSPNQRAWNMAETDVFKAIQSDVEFCQAYSKGMILVDDCAIGKTYSAKYLAKTRTNCFYLDASQTKTKQLFIRRFARTIGVDDKGKYAEVKERLKYSLKVLESPVIIIDEAGDLDYNAFLELKEFWNATEGQCGWYLMGADGLRAKIERGMNHKKVGFREIFSRYSDKYMNIVPTARDQRIDFYKKLITDVVSVNTKDKTIINNIVKRCLTSDASGEIGGLRKAETLLIMNR